MKVGIDAVVLGAWAELHDSAVNVLDVGCGCGVISMIIAQRYSKAIIKGVDIDRGSVEECNHNFINSPWHDRLKVEFCDFNEISGSYDYIISNPPYFGDGVKHIDTSRLIARHQNTLSPMQLLRHGANLLSDNGRLGMVVPHNQLADILCDIQTLNITPRRILNMHGRPELECKRSFIEFQKTTDSSMSGRPTNNSVEISTMYVETNERIYSEEYKKLCKDLYLKF